MVISRPLITVLTLFAVSHGFADSKLKSFVTDGCTVPAPLMRGNYQDCCVLHDYAYWKGGTLEEKQKADASLLSCMSKNGAKEMTVGMWQAVLANFGEGRWGAGWTPKRKNVALTEEEMEEVKTYEKLFKSPLPIVKSHSRKEECPSSLKPTMRTVTNINELGNLNCYPLDGTETAQRRRAVMVISPECKDGYFVYQCHIVKYKDVEPSLQGFGMCADKIKTQAVSNAVQHDYFKSTSALDR